MQFSILSLPTFLIFDLHLSWIIHEQVPTAQSQEQRLLPKSAQPVFYFQQIYYFPLIFLITAGKHQNLQLQRHPFNALWHTISHKSLTLILHFLLENGFK